jgi:N-acetylneuraminate synthase
MPKAVKISDKWVGQGHPAYLIAEIGINHNGDLSVAKRLIDVAVMAGCDAVKFQKRTPEKAVPPGYQEVMRETPWGIMSYLDYRRRVEFGYEEYTEIDRYAREKGIHWFASCWDEESVEFIEQFDPPCFKIASASLTDTPLLTKIKSYGRPVILSTGMSTMEEIVSAVKALDSDNLLIAHSTSAYPCTPHELNLRMIQTLGDKFDCPIGYSGHEVGLQTTYAALTLGATFIERHITLDRAMWGSDQAASVEPWGLMRLVRDLRVIEKALGDGIKKVYESEKKARQKLRRKKNSH